MKSSKLILSILLCLSFLPPVKSSPLDAWTSVRTRNLFLISNAGADELRQVAAWLELFQDAFSKLLSKRVFESSVPTVGIVFRNDRDFQPFKPLYQGKPAELAGYFQPGDDVNYIAISLERGSRDSLNAAFHEYVHLYISNNAPQTPLWLNEGLAEFYSTFELADEQAVVGAPITGYIRLLRNSDQLPLASLFSVDHASAHHHERDKRGIFYAESWALVHYLMLGNNGQRQAQLGRYLSLLGAGVSVENSFNMAFQISLVDMERELNEYIHSDSFPTQRTNFGRRENYGAIETEALSQAEVDYYLGDLLLHTGRQADAERYFVEALSLDANLIKAHEALGIVRVRQGRIAEGQRHLERAAAQSSNYLVHFFYAYVLSRQGVDSQGAVLHYSPETLSLIRKHLQTAIKLAPESAEAYHLLAFVNLVANEQLDQSIELIKRAMRLEPGRQDLKLVLAQFYLRQGETDSGRRILESLARQNDDKELRARAESLLARSEGGVPQVPRFSTAGPSKTVSVVQPGGAAPAAGMNIDTSGTIPDVSAVVANYVKALGGEEKLRKLSSRVTRGTAQVPGEFRKAPFETYEKSPNK